MKRPSLIGLLVLSLLFSSIAPVFAQDGTPANDDANRKTYLPVVSAVPNAELSQAEEDEAEAVTRLEIAGSDQAVRAAVAPELRAAPAWLKDLRLAEPLTVEGVVPPSLNKLSPSLRAANGAAEVVVRLTAPSLSESLSEGVTASAADAGQAVLAAAQAQQVSLVEAARSLDGNSKVLATLSKTLNAVVLRIDAATLTALAQNPDVLTIKRVQNYELDLSETVPYIGGKAVQNMGYDGKGVKVAVLDSGIDYTHAKLGGAGTLEAYALAYGEYTTDTLNTTRDGLFPTAKVVEGYDFVGEAWPDGDLAPDSDPIDCGNTAILDTCDGGHGTHVADIIAGIATARVRVVHASPDAPNVDVWVNGSVAFADVAFKEISAYANLAPGTYNVQVTPAGASEPVVINADLMLESGKDYSVLATNVLASITPLVLVDNNADPAAGKAHVRFVHASPDAPAVDIAVANGGPVIFGNVAFGKVGAYTPVRAGTYDLEVRLAGTDTVVLTLPGITLEEGKVYTAYALGLVADGSLGAALSVDNSVKASGNGVAPGVDLYAVKVCSAVSTSCSGVALLQAMDYVVDPNGDGDMGDAMDVVNMSLGSAYGIAYDDDLSFAVENASKVGVLTVASAGNSADKPYVTGSPAAAPSALSVAQTQVPSATLPRMRIVSPASIAGLYQAIFQDWSAPLTGKIEGPVQYGDNAGGNKLGCTPFAENLPAGTILLVDRGSCSVSVKVSNGAAAGAIAVIIGLVAPGEPFGFGFGGGTPSVPGFNISQTDANKIKANLATGVVVSFDPVDELPLVGHMVGSSSRGPSMRDNLIKPEIGAPGASVSAVAGAGTGTEPFGGTSGAAPMVSGAAALVIQAYPDRSPKEIKALLMNTAETNIMNRPAFFGGYLAPITRIGGGEVRVDRALQSPAAAWNADQTGVAFSYGFVDVTKSQYNEEFDIKLQNYSDRDITYDIAYTFRYADDEAMGAITFEGPASIVVSDNDDREFDVKLKIDSQKLSDVWPMNSGGRGANPEPLTKAEYDGYIVLTERGNPANTIHIPWQVLPRRAGDISLKAKDDSIDVRNRGVGTSTVESYSLLGRNGDLDEGAPGENNPVPDLRYVGYATYLVGPGVCLDEPSFVMAFAVNSWERQTHANAPASFEFDFDLDGDGKYDYGIWSQDISGYFSLTDGRNVAVVYNYATKEAQAWFLTDHQTNSANTVLMLCAEQLGLTSADLDKQMAVGAYAFDNYFTGEYTDAIEGLTIRPVQKYLGLFRVPDADAEEGYVEASSVDIPSMTTDKLYIARNDVDNTEQGVLLLYRNGSKEGKEAGIVKVND